MFIFINVLKAYFHITFKRFLLFFYVLCLYEQEDFLNDFGVHLETNMEEDDSSLVLTSPSKLSNANNNSHGHHHHHHHTREKKKSYFVNPTWLVTERVLDVDESIDMKADASTWPLAEEMVKEGSKFKILVKWQGLPYSLATWELASEVPDPMAVTEAIQMFFKREMQSFTGKSRSGNRDQHKSKEDISNGLPVQFENGGALRDYQVCWCVF